MQLDLRKLKIIDYEGAGNRTPVLDISNFVDNTRNPLEVRKELEKDISFRRWLKEEGLRHKADSIMIFYNADNPLYDFVTFIGEPNSPLQNKFSEMCGNGIRALSLHILSESSQAKRKKYLHNGITIWAGSIRKIIIGDFNESEGTAMIAVNLGKINITSDALAPYVNINSFSERELSRVRLPITATHYLSDRDFGIGFNGEVAGEPHVVLLNNKDQYLALVRAFNLPIKLDKETLINNLRIMASCFGKRFTFNFKHFPLGINFNIALVLDGIIYMSTHERNMSKGQSECSEQIAENDFCACNTLACGTGGSIVCAIAKEQGLVGGLSFVTIHPGGEIRYEIKNNESIMTGPAKRTENLRSSSKTSQSLSKTFLME